jgi:prepilin-type processing-associated H-X9-DG protein
MRRVLHPVGLTSIEILLLLGIVVVMISALVPAVQSAREAASRAQYGSNLKILTPAAQSQVDVSSLLPARLPAPDNLKGSAPREDRDVLIGRAPSTEKTSPGDAANHAPRSGDALDLTSAGLGVTRFRSFKEEPSVLGFASLESLPDALGDAKTNGPFFDDSSDSVVDLLTRARDPQWPSDSVWEFSPSSFHPGGANFTFCDGGSVRFIKDTINSWPVNSSTAAPHGANADSLNSIGTIAAGPRPGTYQALCALNLGELVTDYKY